jgi:hypothetical protein
MPDEPKVVSKVKSVSLLNLAKAKTVLPLAL